MSYRRRGAYAPAGPSVEAAAPSSLPLATVPPFTVTYTGSFDPAGSYEADIVSSDDQWTVTEDVAVDATSLVATFHDPPDGAAGLGHTLVKDLVSGEFGASVPFAWTASRARSKAKPKPKGKR